MTTENVLENLITHDLSFVAKPRFEWLKQYRSQEVTQLFNKLCVEDNLPLIKLICNYADSKVVKECVSDGLYLSAHHASVNVFKYLALDRKTPFIETVCLSSIEKQKIHTNKMASYEEIESVIKLVRATNQLERSPKPSKRKIF